MTASFMCWLSANVEEMSLFLVYANDALRSLLILVPLLVSQDGCVHVQSLVSSNVMDFLS